MYRQPFRPFFLFSALAKCEKKLELFFLFRLKMKFLDLPNLHKTIPNAFFEKCQTESNADCLKKMNIDMLSKTTTKSSSWKFILSAWKKTILTLVKL